MAGEHPHLPTFRRHVAWWLVNRRTARGWTQVRAAREIGVSTTRYANWERGIASPHADVLLPIVDALGGTVEGLLGREMEREAG